MAPRLNLTELSFWPGLRKKLARRSWSKAPASLAEEARWSNALERPGFFLSSRLHGRSSS